MNTGGQHSSILKNKKIILGITGSIAAFKAASICSSLVKSGAEVFCVLTPNACRFINPITLSSISGKKAIVSQYANEEKIWHISLSQSADVILIAPASANTISKIACGICDNFLTTAVAASSCPIIIAPAMNSYMYENPIIQKNIDMLKNAGNYFIVEPDSGMLACGSEGTGRLAGEEKIIAEVSDCIMFSGDLKNKKILISAGGTMEFLDPVRFISNRSSGKMGHEIAREAHFRGADEVVLVSSASGVMLPKGIKFIKVQGSNMMMEEILKHYSDADVTIMAAAVSDIIPVSKYDYKLKKNDDIISKLKFRENINILSMLAEKKNKAQYLAGFSAESGENIENTVEKMKNKNIDMMVLNDISRNDIGFESDYNEAVIISSNGDMKKTGKNRKRIVARIILNKIINDLK